MYFVVECVTMSAPNSKGRQLTGVANVLSTMSGTPCACARRANFSMSSTTSEGFESVSAKTALVFGRKALARSTSGRSGSTSVKSMPMRFIVTVKRFDVPP